MRWIYRQGRVGASELVVEVQQVAGRHGEIRKTWLRESKNVISIKTW